MSYTTMYGLTYTVEAALSASTGSYGAWDSGLWNTATWGPDVIWTDITPYVVTINTQRQFSRDLQVWQSGTASVVLRNEDARFTASNLSGPYVSGGITMVRPWRPLRIRCTYAGVTYEIFHGYVKRWPRTYDQPSPNAGGATVTMQCVDEYASLARFDGLEQLAVGAGESTGKRVARILDNAGSTAPRNIDSGVMTTQATTLAANAATELALVADSEGGALWVEADGTVTFENFTALIDNTRSNTVQGTFGDLGGDLAYNDFTEDDNADLMTNIAAFARTGGTSQVSTDETSRALYEDKRQSRTDLVCETDTQVKALADLWIRRYKDPEDRYSSVTLKPRYDPARLFPQALGRRVRDLVRVRRKPPGGITNSQDLYIAGITHTITMDDFTTVFDLWSAKPYTTFSTSRWGAGLWDSATWFI